MQFGVDAIGIVGASGFIGRALVQGLIAGTLDRPKLFGRTKSVISGCAVEKLTTKPSGFDGLQCVVHLAAIADSRAPEGELDRANVTFAGDVARAAAQAGVRRFVFVSSLLVHGRAAADPIGPETRFNPTNAYGRSKVSAESLLRKIADESRMELVILRPPMVYGAGSKGNFALLARLIQRGLPLPFGLAKAQRSFCSIGNLVSAIWHAMFLAKPGSVLIPADPDDFDVATLVTRMAEVMERPLRLIPVPKTFIAWPLAILGRAEMAASIFEPLQVDRTHWKQVGWKPVETGMDGIRTALARSRTVLYITNSTPYFFSHRLMLAREASRRGFHVTLAGGDVLGHSERLGAEGIVPLAIPDIKRGISPLGDLRAASAIAAYVSRQGTSVVHASGLKTMFICALANFLKRMPRVVCIVTGLGSLYVNDTLKTRSIRFGIETILRPLLRRQATLSVFQNTDDHTYFLKKGIVRVDNSFVIKGSGVDTQEYPFAEEPESDRPLVVFPARILKSKGVMEFATAADILLSKGVNARFALVGDRDPDNPDTLTENDVAGLRTKGNVEFWGFREDMASVFAQCHIACLPSYREGVPKALIEAASVGRAIVTTDVPGCREIVVDGENGLLVPPRDPQRLADTLEVLISDRNLRQKMGLVGRRMVEEKFSASIVIAAMADLYEIPVVGTS